MWFEKWTIENRAFVLSAFAAHIEMLERIKEISQLSNSFSKMVRFEAHAAYFNDLCIHVALYHFIKKLLLRFIPKIGQTN